MSRPTGPSEPEAMAELWRAVFASEYVRLLAATGVSFGDKVMGPVRVAADVADKAVERLRAFREERGGFAVDLAVPFGPFERAMAKPGTDPVELERVAIIREIRQTIAEMRSDGDSPRKYATLEGLADWVAARGARPPEALSPHPYKGCDGHGTPIGKTFTCVVKCHVSGCDLDALDPIHNTAADL